MILKVITLNVNHGGELIDDIKTFLRAEQPDILYLQEAYNGTNSQAEARSRTVETCKQAILAPFSFFSPILFDLDMNVDRGNVIISRFPIEDQKAIPFNGVYQRIKNEGQLGDWSDQACVLQKCTIVLPHTSLMCLNIHGIWGQDGGDSEKRTQQCLMIIEALQTDVKTLLMGDFNMNPNTKGVTMISQRLTSVFADTLKTTFNMKRKTNPDYGGAVVDMMFVSSDMTVLEKECPDVDISDHLPLIARIEV